MKSFMHKAAFLGFIVLCALSPLAAFGMEACPAMTGGAAMGSASAACCGSGDCQCGMKSQSSEMDLAMLPATTVPARQGSVTFEATPFNVLTISSAQHEPAQTGSPPKSSNKEKIYDLHSDYRI